MESPDANTTPTSEELPVRTTVTPASRIWFGWFALVAVVVTIPCCILQIITHSWWPNARNFKRWSGLWGRGVLGGAGIRVRLIEHRTLDPEKPYVFVVNHQNLLDILATANGLPYPFGFVAKSELRKVPFLGLAIRRSASIFLDRSDPRAAMASLHEAGRRIRGGNSVLVFAEGRRSYGPTLLPFKKGAFAVAVEAGVPLVPLVVLDAWKRMDERAFSARPGTMHIAVCEPIPTADLRRKDIPELMETVRRRMEQELTHARLMNA